MSLLIVLTYKPYPWDISAQSPKFTGQEVRDERFDLFPVNHDLIGSYANRSISFTDISTSPVDISSINYVSDGRFLNATLWLTRPFPIALPHNITFGMIIDSDGNEKTGFGGGDYQVKISGGQNQTWTRRIYR